MRVLSVLMCLFVFSGGLTVVCGLVGFSYEMHTLSFMAVEVSFYLCAVHVNLFVCVSESVYMWKQVSYTSVQILKNHCFSTVPYGNHIYEPCNSTVSICKSELHHPHSNKQTNKHGSAFTNYITASPA